MDPNKLPRRALIDTGVMFRAMGQFADAHTQDCIDFYQAMLMFGNDILIAAPTVAEIMRHDGTTQIPRTRQIEVVAFDQVAAELLGRSLPMATLKTIQGPANTTLTHLKYDALIATCAARHGADCIVAIDGHFVALGQALGLQVEHPSAFRATQTALPLAGAQQVVAQPAQPVAAQPAAQPVAAQPAAAQPVAAQPAPQPAAAQPVTAQTAGAQPVATQPAATQPVMQPAVQPVAGEPSEPD